MRPNNHRVAAAVPIARSQHSRLELIASYRLEPRNKQCPVRVRSENVAVYHLLGSLLTRAPAHGNVHVLSTLQDHTVSPLPSPVQPTLVTIPQHTARIHCFTQLW